MEFLLGIIAGFVIAISLVIVALQWMDIRMYGPCEPTWNSPISWVHFVLTLFGAKKRNA